MDNLDIVHDEDRDRFALFGPNLHRDTFTTSNMINSKKNHQIVSRHCPIKTARLIQYSGTLLGPTFGVTVNEFVDRIHSASGWSLVMFEKGSICWGKVIL